MTLEQTVDNEVKQYAKLVQDAFTAWMSLYPVFDDAAELLEGLSTQRSSPREIFEEEFDTEVSSDGDWSQNTTEDPIDGYDLGYSSDDSAEENNMNDDLMKILEGDWNSKLGTGMTLHRKYK